jgi:hypothetical protein
MQLLMNNMKYSFLVKEQVGNRLQTSECTMCMGVDEHGAGLELMVQQCCLALMQASHINSIEPGLMEMLDAADAASCRCSAPMCPLQRWSRLSVTVCVNLEVSVCAADTKDKGCRSITSRFHNAQAVRGRKDGRGWWILVAIECDQVAQLD